MRQIPNQCIDLVFADPPFNIDYGYDAYDDNRTADEYLAWSRTWTAEAVRVLKPTGTLWLAIGDEYAAELKVMLQSEHGLSLRNWVIWYYTFGVHCTGKFGRSHTHLLYLVRDPDNCTFNPADIRVPSARQLIYGDDRAHPDGRIPDNTWILRPQAIPQSFQPESDTWYIPRVNGTFAERQGWHGCQMPEQLLGRILRACSRSTDVILDPFAGSGTTLAVAKKLGRRFIGFELSADYAARARQRVAVIRAGDPLEGADNPMYAGPSVSRKRLAVDPSQQDLF